MKKQILFFALLMGVIGFNANAQKGKLKAETIKSQRELTKARTEPYQGGAAIKSDS